MVKRNFSIREYGFKTNPFSKDRVDPDTFNQEKFDKLIYKSPEIMRILQNEENFQLITGFPGTGKTITFLYLQNQVNLEFNGILAVYLGDVSLLLASKDLLDESKHMSDISNNIICRIWATFIQVLQDHEEKDILKKIKHSKFWNKFKKGITAFLSISVRSALKNKLEIDIEDSAKISIPDTSLRDIIETVKEIKDISQSKVKKIYLLFDELGEYTKKFNKKVAESGLKAKTPYFYQYLSQLKDQEGILIKVAGYPDAVKYFSGVGLEHSHMHWESLDPRFFKKAEFNQKMEEFFQLTTNMFLKRVDHFHLNPEISDKKEKLIFSITAGIGYMMFKDNTAIRRICSFSNFNPRLALNIASEAFMKACSIERNDFEFNSKDREDYKSLKGVILPYHLIREAIINKSRELRVEEILSKFLFGNKFFNKLAESGGNFFTLPHIASIKEENENNARDFTEFFESLKKTRLVLQYPSRIKIKNEQRNLYAIDMEFYYYWFRTFTSRPELADYKKYKGFDNFYKKCVEKPSHKDIPQHYVIKDFTTEEIQDFFIMGDKMDNLHSKIERLEQEKSRIEKKLSSFVTDEEEEILLSKQQEIRRKQRKLNGELMKLQNEETYVNNEQPDVSTNLYGETPKEKFASIDSSKESKNVISFFIEEGFPKFIEEMGIILYPIISSLTKDNVVPEFSVVKSYIKVFNTRDNNWYLLIRKTKKALNLYIFTPDQEEHDIFNIFPQLQSNDIEWKWSYSYGKELLWIKLKESKELKSYSKEFHDILLCSFNGEWKY